MRVINKYVVIDKVNEQVETDFGLILSESDVNDIRYKKGIVISPGHMVDTVNADDVVMYDGSAGYTVMVGDRQLTVIQERDIILVE